MINFVRNIVLSVLNKNNYGYISPSDFNLYAKNAQMELFEQYFKDYNKAVNMENARMAGSDYAEVEGPLAETLETFLVSKFISHIGGNKFSAPSVTTTGDTAYYILKMLCYTDSKLSGTNSSVLVNSLVDVSADFSSVKPGDIVVNTSTNKVALALNVPSATTITLDSDIFLATPVNYKIYSSKVKEAEKVSVGKITSLNNSLLTKPNNIFPAYTLEGNAINIYADTVSGLGQAQAVYFRHPKDPKWTYISVANGTPVFDQSQPDYQDFELPEEDVYRLTMKILQYCGISIREAEVAQYAMIQEQQQNQ